MNKDVIIVNRNLPQESDGETAGNKLYLSIKAIIDEARKNVYRAVNSTMVKAYWNIGRLIVEDEQKGAERAEYGTFLIKGLSRRLTAEFGRGFNSSNLKRMRQFYRLFTIRTALPSESDNGAISGHQLRIDRTVDHDFNKKGAAVRHLLEKNSTNDASQCHILEKNSAALRHLSNGVTILTVDPTLSWTHYKLLIRVENPSAREWYMREAAEQNWSTRALERQIHSLYYERLLASKDKRPVMEEAKEITLDIPQDPKEYLKDPYILEFLNISDRHNFRESELEQAIIDKLQEFLLELGKGFAFVARQKRISTETSDFYIDLVFYNYYLKCFVLIDLKTGKLTHQDIGQMDMYVRMFDDLQRANDDNPTVGLVLCTEKDETVVRYSVMGVNKQLFASKYMLYLPGEDELKAELERQKRMIEMEMRDRAEGK